MADIPIQEKMGQQTYIGEKRVLFVDDEPGVLRALRRALRRRSAWQLSFAESAAKALEQMSKTSFDIVVSDVTMPHTNGVTFLQEVRSRYPDTLRFLMSGAAQGDLLRQAVPVAHRYFAKPWDLGALMSELERAFELRAKMGQVAVRTAIGGMVSPPVLPGTLRELRATLEDPASRWQDILRVVEQDPSMVARVLHIVNSAFFAEARALSDPSKALRHIGTSRLKALLLAGETFHVLDEEAPDLSISRFQEHARLSARIAGALTPGDPALARSAGLLHSIGKLILLDRMPERWAQSNQQARDEKRALHEVEQEHFGTTYAEVGAYVLGIWGLPRELVQAVEQHCNPARSGDGSLDLIAVTHLASVLAAHELGVAGYEFDGDLLGILDGKSHMEAWREIATRLAQR